LELEEHNAGLAEEDNNIWFYILMREFPEQAERVREESISYRDVYLAELNKYELRLEMAKQKLKRSYDEVSAERKSRTARVVDKVAPKKIRPSVSRSGHKTIFQKTATAVRKDVSLIRHKNSVNKMTPIMGKVIRPYKVKTKAIGHSANSIKKDRTKDLMNELDSVFSEAAVDKIQRKSATTSPTIDHKSVGFLSDKLEMVKQQQKQKKSTKNGSMMKGLDALFEEVLYLLLRLYFKGSQREAYEDTKG
jgi:hypothetical protein